jgi:phosphoribosyl 1,2-cyclic phosphate phosphodiesterase
MSGPAEQITATILGCGSSGGVPRVGNLWGDCDPNNPRNRRRRCALLITGKSEGCDEPTQILIDAGCDLREQLIDADVAHLDAVLITHDHADHIHGLDDLRALALINRRKIDVYRSEETAKRLEVAFSYCFETPPGSSYPPILNLHDLDSGNELTVEGPGGSIIVQAFRQHHGDVDSLGFRIRNFAYSCDVADFPAESLSFISGLEVWVIDALRRTPHPSHLSLEQSLEWIERMEPRRAVLTNMHTDLDYKTLEAELPAHVTPGFDGMRIDIGNRGTSS